MNWTDLGDDCFVMEEIIGEFTIRAQVMLGGNGRWTPLAHCAHRGRRRKNGPGFVAGKVVRSEYPGQVSTKAEAIEWAERMFCDMRAEIDSQEIPAYNSV